MFDNYIVPVFFGGGARCKNIHADVERQEGDSSNAGLAQSFIKDDSYGCG